MLRLLQRPLRGAFELISERTMKDRHLVTLEPIPRKSKTARTKNYFIEIGDRSRLLAVAWPHDLDPKNEDGTAGDSKQKRAVPQRKVANTAAAAPEAEKPNDAPQETYGDMGFLKPFPTNVPLEYVPKIPEKPADPPKPDRFFYFHIESRLLAASSVGGPYNLKRNKARPQNAWAARKDRGKVSREVTTRRKQEEEVEAERQSKQRKTWGGFSGAQCQAGAGAYGDRQWGNAGAGAYGGGQWGKAGAGAFGGGQWGNAGAGAFGAGGGNAGVVREECSGPAAPWTSMRPRTPACRSWATHPSGSTSAGRGSQGRGRPCPWPCPGPIHKRPRRIHPRASPIHMHPSPPIRPSPENGQVESRQATRCQGEEARATLKKGLCAVCGRHAI
ncbi:hypothetical protein M427DRAFT_161068 [Gonapodya prolifera JEL478]|uniref:Uncharacterized protein n=1 Tax=Gonapodya prolifera (strain JEL478) TaxID=1344416 RepID=A0A138ZX97_GONPJ|nr:hypothetical protein M427DRAFT_161068 [Gonapodya prolifera JEL478]|eukprot:KXS09126.1 hypothetical protein M427DRAFT_161068 [Gonapodya prolifera JEL478]